MNLLLLTGNACNKCEFIKPKLVELCEAKWISLEVMDALEYKWDHLNEVTSLPTMIISQELVEDVVLDYDWIMNWYLSNNN